MKTASRSVSDSELRRYEAYAQQIQSSKGSFNFRFSGEGSTENPGGASLGNDGEDDDLYS